MKEDESSLKTIGAPATVGTSHNPPGLHSLYPSIQALPTSDAPRI